MQFVEKQLPAKQGLKPIPVTTIVYPSVMVEKQLPAKQGLKPDVRSSAFSLLPSRKTASSKTRIETKLSYLLCLRVLYCRKTASSKTRIETIPISNLLVVQYYVEKQLPAKQGLKLCISDNDGFVIRGRKTASSKTRIETNEYR